MDDRKAVFGFVGLAAFFPVCSFSEAVLAQQLPSPQPLPSLPVLVPSNPESNPTAIPPEAIPGSVVIRKFELLDNEILTPAEVAAVVAPYTLRQLSLVELLEVPRKLTELIVAKGYITTSAVIPPQEIEDRTVKIQIVPGTLEAIKITGLEQIRDSYIRSRIARGAASPLNQNRLLNQLQLLQLNPLIENISAELSQGIEPNTSLLEVDVTEADTFNIGLSIDNSKVASIGTMSRDLELRENNFLGIGDRFIAAYSNSDGSDSLSNLSYQLPLSAANNSIGLSHNRGDNRIIQEPFDELDIKNKTRYYALSYTQPLLQSPNREVSLGLSLARESSKTTFLEGEPFPNVVGATNSEGKTIVNTASFSQDYLQRDRSSVFYLRSNFVLGLDVFDAVIDADKPDGKFLAWQGYAQYLNQISPNSTLSVESNIQLANDSLVPIKQFTAGGIYSVRGYPQNALIGDNGVFVSTEFSHTLASNSSGKTRLEIIPFLDLGKVWNTETNIGKINTLVGIGTGLKLSIGKRLTARIDFGLPLVDLEVEGDSLQENGVYFSLRTQL